MFVLWVLKDFGGLNLYFGIYSKFKFFEKITYRYVGSWKIVGVREIFTLNFEQSHNCILHLHPKT